MSIMACERKDCDNILCNRLILKNSYYICPECWKELLEVKKTWVPPIVVQDKILEFMKSAKPSDQLQDIDDEFNRLCPPYFED